MGKKILEKDQLAQPTRHILDLFERTPSKSHNFLAWPDSSLKDLYGRTFVKKKNKMDEEEEEDEEPPLENASNLCEDSALK